VLFTFFPKRKEIFPLLERSVYGINIKQWENKEPLSGAGRQRLYSAEIKIEALIELDLLTISSDSITNS